MVVESRRGQARVRAFVTPTVPAGHLFLPMHDGSTNRLTDAVFDPESRQPAYKACAARVRAIGPSSRRRRRRTTSIPQHHDREPTRMIARNRERKTVVVIGNGMVGHRFCERLVEYDRRPELSDRDVLRGAAPRLRPRQPDEILRTPRRRPPAAGLREDWYADNGITLHVGDRATAIDRERRLVISRQGREVGYDAVVLATGSAPFVPTVPGRRQEGGVRLPDDRGPRADPRLCREGGVARR